MDEEIYKELAVYCLFFAQLMATEIILSLFLTVRGRTIRSTFSNKFVSTTKFLFGLFIIVTSVFVFTQIFNESIVDFLLKFKIILVPMLISSIFFDLFYATKVNLSRRWRFKVTIVTLTIFLIALTITIIMILNDNVLLQELQTLLGMPIQEDQ